MPWYNWNIVESGIKYHKPNIKAIISNLKIVQLLLPPMPFWNILLILFYFTNAVILVRNTQVISPFKVWQAGYQKKMENLKI